MSLAVSSHVGSEPGWGVDALIICALERAYAICTSETGTECWTDEHTEFLRSLLSTYCTFHINGIS